MRRVLAGIFLLLLIPTFVYAEIKGEVESIGFGSFYRPNCYVPMLVRVQADVSGTYQIQVVQEDLDRDLQIFAQTVSLTGAEDGKGAEQRFWMYFIPQPGDSGLPDSTSGGSLRDLQQELKVFLCDEKGTKQLAQLTVTSQITNIDNEQAGPSQSTTPRGNRLILTVSDSSAQPIWHDYKKAIGTMEDVIFVQVRSTDLPEDLRGYDMIDGIIWLAAPLPDPRRPSDEKRFEAIQSYVRNGGHLVVCQPAQKDAIAPIREMLPVNVLEVAPRSNLEPLKTLATQNRKQLEAEREAESKQRATAAGRTEDPLPDTTRRKRDDWTLPTGPFLFARAEAKPGAIVDPLQLKWNADGSDQSPYIARRGYGMGCVTWVAHDLSDPSITGKAKTGWPYVWDRVLDYKHDLTIVDQDTLEESKQRYAQITVSDVSKPLLEGLKLTAKSNKLIAIAVVFFIAYWALAGPGVYFYLLTRSRPQLSWFLFAFSAVAATLLTVLVVKVVVRGAPEMAHITIVRGGIDVPQVSISRFGLYIPRDGDEEIALTEVQPRQVSYVTADARHPRHASGTIEFPAQEKYFIPIHDSSEEGPVKISVPFRSTAKEFQIRRVGPTQGAIDGSGKLRETEAGNVLEGMVTNGTGNRLRNVYLVYHDPRASDDVAFYVPKLEKSQTVDLREMRINAMKKIGEDDAPMYGRPEQEIRLYGVLGTPGIQNPNTWSYYWYRGAKVSGMETQYDDLSKALPMLSLFHRLPPIRNGWRDTQSKSPVDRYEVLRRGGRDLDASQVVAAGQLLVLAEADEQGKQPLPYPLQVEGEKVAGKGIHYYQFALPLQRIAAPPATQPATSVKLGTQPAVAATVEANPWPR